MWNCIDSKSQINDGNIISFYNKWEGKWISFIFDNITFTRVELIIWMSDKT